MHVYLAPRSCSALGNTRMLNKITKVSRHISTVRGIYTFFGPISPVHTLTVSGHFKYFTKLECSWHNYKMTRTFAPNVQWLCP